MMMNETMGWVVFSMASGWGMAQMWFAAEKIAQRFKARAA